MCSSSSCLDFTDLVQEARVRGFVRGPVSRTGERKILLGFYFSQDTDSVWQRGRSVSTSHRKNRSTNTQTDHRAASADGKVVVDENDDDDLNKSNSEFFTWVAQLLGVRCQTKV